MEGQQPLYGNCATQTARLEMKFGSAAERQKYSMEARYDLVE